MEKVQKKRMSKTAKIIIWFLWLSVFTVLLGGILLFYQLSKSGIPQFTEIENPKYNIASIIYGNRQDEIGKYYIDNRVNLDYQEINPKIIKTLINTEDIRYLDHSAIDFKSLFRVAIKTIVLQQKSGGGGSTITQQLAKLLYKRPSLRGKSKLSYITSLIAIKLREWITAVKLERNYTKEEILAMYLNKFDFIYGAKGLHAASEIYFSKNQKDLDFGEAAVLVGMLKNPVLYNPIKQPSRTTSRRNLILHLLANNKLIESTLLDSLTSKPINTTEFKKESHLIGNALHFRASLAKRVKSILDDPKNFKPDGTPYNLYTDGLKIYTSIDIIYQQKAEEAVKNHMEWNQDNYWEVWKHKNPWTYKATPYQLKLRQKDLDSKLKSTHRYLHLRNKVLGEILTKIRGEYPIIPLSDIVITRLIAVDKGSLSWDSKPIANLKHINKYQSLLKKKTWQKLKVAYQHLQDTTQVVFDQKITMKIFDYNNEGFKVVEMSPLDSIKYHAQILQAGLLSVDAHTGYIKAWVGGVDYNYFKYDHISSRRQVGSTIKPFVYATAISLQGISPCQGFEDIQYTIAPGEANFDVDEEWSPANANERFTGNKYNLFQGLLYSKNSITVRLVKEMGTVQVIRKLLDNVGIDINEKLYNGRDLVPNLPSICLGSVDLSVKEMVGAYTTFANKGRYVKPTMLQKIVDQQGKIIFQHTPINKQALSPLYASLMVDMLRNNVGGRYGLGVNTQVGGKTGTTNDYNDGWFMCITPDLVTGVWVGGDNKWFRFLTLDDGQGYVVARPIIQKYLKKLEKDTLSGFNKKAKFPDPPRGFQALTDCDKYKVVSPEDEIKKRLERKLEEDNMEDEFDEEMDETHTDSPDSPSEDSLTSNPILESTTDSLYQKNSKQLPDSIR